MRKQAMLHMDRRPANETELVSWVKPESAASGRVSHNRLPDRLKNSDLGEITFDVPYLVSRITVEFKCDIGVYSWRVTEVRCPFCKEDSDKVIDSRASEGGRIIRRRREGRHIYYTLDDEHIATIYRCGLEHLNHA